MCKIPPKYPCFMPTQAKMTLRQIVFCINLGRMSTNILGTCENYSLSYQMHG